jgi:pimeloyl-ACP methyl ester carboxylesterase
MPNARLTVIDGAGHMPHHSHADIVVAAVLRAALR